MENTFKIDENNEGTRLDIFLKNSFEDFSRNNIQNIIESQNVLINNKSKKPSYKLKLGDLVYIKIEKPKEINILPKNIPLNIIYENNHIIVIDKPQGMVVHPAPGNYENTLVNALLYYCQGNLSGINGFLRPGIVHRIDKDTSGVLVIAKNNKAHNILSEQLKNHTCNRLYEAIVYNNIKEDNLTIDKPIGRHHINRKKMCVTNKNSKKAVTHIKVLDRYLKYSLIEAKLDTGRTHQIRVHMSYIGNPLLGDTVYGKEKQPFNLKGQVLHAKLLGFIDPEDGKYKEFLSPLPNYFEKLKERFKI